MKPSYSSFFLPAIHEMRQLDSSFFLAAVDGIKLVLQIIEWVMRHRACLHILLNAIIITIIVSSGLLKSNNNNNNNKGSDSPPSELRRTPPAPMIKMVNPSDLRGRSSPGVNEECQSGQGNDTNKKNVQSPIPIPMPCRLPHFIMLSDIAVTVPPRAHGTQTKANKINIRHDTHSLSLSLSREELNSRADAFIRNFCHQLRLQH